MPTLPLTHPVPVFALLLALILFVPLLARKARLPDIVGLILAGLALGPTGLQVLERGEAIKLLGTVGLLYIMFLAGLEIELQQFARYRNRSLIFGGLTFAIPQAVGMLVGRYLLGFTWVQSTLLASMLASHTLLAYPLAARLGLGRREAVLVAVGGTVITDTVALLILGVIAESTRGELTVTFWLRLALAMAVYLVIMRHAVPPLVRYFLRQVSESGGAQFLFVLTIVFLSAWGAELAGVEPIIGAFVAGVVLNQFIPANSALMNRVQFFGHTFFVPFFLLSVGMLVDLKALLGDARAWLVMGAMTVTVHLTKYWAARASEKLCGYSRDEGWVIFGLSVVQAAATLAAVIVGYEVKVFTGPHVLNGAILMILVSCVIGPWAVERYGRRLALATSEPPEELPETLRLEQRIVAPVGNPATMRALLEFAFLLRNRDLPGMIYPLRIVPDGPGAERQVSKDEELLARCVAQAASADMAVSPLVRLDLNPVDGIVRATREVRATTLVMGWQGHRTPGSYIFGGIFDQVLEQCPQRVLVCRLGPPLNLTRRLTAIIPPYLESEADFATVLQRIKWLAHQTGSTLRLCYPATTGQRLPELCRQTRPQLTVEYAALPDWPHDEELLKLLPACPRDELLVLVAARRDTPAWQPHLERLPSLLAETYPSHNLIVIYPLSVQAEETAAAPPPAIAEALLPPLRAVLLECPAGPWEPVIDSLLAEALPTDLERRAGIARQVAASATEFPVELQPGVVLLHAHCEEVDELQLHLARSSGGLTLPGLTQPAHLLLVLLTPREHPPEQYLQALGALARLLRQPGMIEQVRQAPTIAALHAHFLIAPPPG